MKNFLLLIFILNVFSTFSQVGLGEVNPTAALEIKTEPSGLPAIRLSTQNTPIGTQTGQIVIIDNKLFLFDGTRDKWLSVEQTVLEYGRKGSGSSPAEVEFGGGDLQNGPRMPFNGTIVGISLSASDDDNSRDIFFYVNGVAVPNNDASPEIDGVFNLDPVSKTYNDANYNFDFDAGDMLSYSIDDTINDINDLIITLYIKWRKENP